MKNKHNDYSFIFLCVIILAGMVAACLPSAPATNATAPAAIVQHVNAAAPHSAVNAAVRGES